MANASRTCVSDAADYFIETSDSTDVWSSGTFVFIDATISMGAILNEVATTGLTAGASESLAIIANAAVTSVLSGVATITFTTQDNIVPLGNLTFGQALAFAVTDAFAAIGYETIGLSQEFAASAAYTPSAQPSWIAIVTLSVVDQLAAAGYIVGPDSAKAIATYITQAYMTSAVIGETFLVPAMISGYTAQSGMTGDLVYV